MNTLKTQNRSHKVYLVDGARTPFLRAEGKPGPFSASDLAVQCGRPLLNRQQFDPQDIDEVIVGCVAPSHDEANIARVISLRLGCGHATPAWTVQRNCASGMQAVDSAFQSISSGKADLVLAGGTEAMSHYPLVFSQAMTIWFANWSRARSWQNRGRLIAQLRPAHFQPVISLLRGLTDQTIGMSMGQTAERLAWLFDVSRDEMDAFALASHQRLTRAAESGLLREIEPMISAQGELFDFDNGVRPDSSVEKLSKLRPVFDYPVGKVTAGNSAQITDGAALLLLASEQAVKEHHLAIAGEIIDCQWSALDPAEMGLGPVHAMATLLLRNDLKTADIDYWEINEAFAAQVIACLKAWGDPEYMASHLGIEKPFEPIDAARLNIDGGSISMGHPVGASGARLILHLLRTLEQTNSRRGIASLCIGGGQGGAMLIARNREEL